MDLTDGRGEPLDGVLDYSTIDIVKVRTKTPTTNGKPKALGMMLYTQ